MSHFDAPPNLSPVRAVGPRGPWYRILDCSATSSLLFDLLQSRGCGTGDLLLESVRNGDQQNCEADQTNYSFLMLSPAVWYSTRGTHVSDWRRVESAVTGFVQETLPPDFPPFAGGAAGLIAYDWCRALERIPQPARDDFQVPALALGVYDHVLALDHRHSLLYLIATGYPHTDLGQRETAALGCLDQLTSWLSGDSGCSTSSRSTGRRLSSHLDLSGYHRVTDLESELPAGLDGELLSGTSRTSYAESLARAIRYLRSGDIFQVNLAQQLLVPLRHSPHEFYRRMRLHNAAPFAAYFDLGNHHLVSASPERLVRVRGRQVQTRPIKGTRRLTGDAEQDQTQGESLRASEKDCAENLMIVDLLRNDLSRVCRPESLRVHQLCRLEQYRHVQHLVSVVEGTLSGERTPWDLFLAIFPGGSISGAPKVRAMEIINELEPVARGAYCGSLGYIGFPNASGEMNSDWNILIRTATLCGEWCQIPVGGGIVLGSQLHAEYTETLDKARGLLLAAALATEGVA